MIAEASLGDGVLGLDETGVPTQGKASVGGERQSSGPLGQGGHGQIAVTCCDTDAPATWPVAVRWYGPKAWTDTPERRAQARGPTAVTCQTTPERALARLDQARAWGVPHRCLVAEADAGANPTVLAGLETRQEPYVVAVRTDVRVSRGRTASSPVWRADEWLHRVPRGPWRTVRWRRGATGWWRQTCVAVQSWRVTSQGQRSPGWVVGERATPGPPEERKDSWSHLPAETTLAELAGYAHRRQAMEPCHEEANGELGWDQDQGRLWPGVHRHAVTVRLAYRFLVWLERRPQGRSTRSGRPGDPLSPPPGAPPQDAPRRAP
jgi:SRSO17 transposase